jgi:hypothetical protein
LIYWKAVVDARKQGGREGEEEGRWRAKGREENNAERRQNLRGRERGARGSLVVTTESERGTEAQGRDFS